MPIKKKPFVALMIVVVLLLLSACGASGKTTGSSTTGGASTGGTGTEAAKTSAPPDKVRFAYFPAFHTMVVFVADKGGFFKKQNIDVEMILTDRGSLQISMLVANQADIATADITSIASTNAQGKDLVHIFPTSQNMSMNFVASKTAMERLGVKGDDPLDKKLQALGKMKIGITGPNAPTDIYTRFLLTKAGFNPDKDVQMISLSNAGNLMAALKSGQIDGFMLTPPTPNQPELEGYGTVLIKSSAGEVPELANYPYQGVTARKEWLTANPDVTGRFVKALMEATKFIREKPEEAKTYLKAYFEEMKDESIQAGMNDMIPSLPTDGLMSEQFVSHYLELNKQLGILQLPQLPSAKEGVLWTNEYVKKASQ